jgi:hypothetical protein
MWRSGERQIARESREFRLSSNGQINSMPRLKFLYRHKRVQRYRYFKHEKETNHWFPIWELSFLNLARRLLP